MQKHNKRIVPNGYGGLQTVAKLFCQKDFKTDYFYWKLVFWRHNNTDKERDGHFEINLQPKT